jgi:hypothetical protein
MFKPINADNVLYISEKTFIIFEVNNKIFKTAEVVKGMYLFDYLTKYERYIYHESGGYTLSELLNEAVYRNFVSNRLLLTTYSADTRLRPYHY